MASYSVFIVTTDIELDGGKTVLSGTLCAKVDETKEGRKQNHILIYPEGDDVIVMHSDDKALENYFNPVEESLSLSPRVAEYAEAYANTQSFQKGSCFQYTPEAFSRLPDQSEPLDMFCISANTLNIHMGISDPITGGFDSIVIKRPDLARALESFHAITSELFKSDDMRKIYNASDVHAEFKRGTWLSDPQDKNSIYYCAKIRNDKPTLMQFEKVSAGGYNETQISLLILNAKGQGKLYENRFLNQLIEIEQPPLPKPLNKISITYTPYSKLQIEDRGLPKDERLKISLRLPRQMAWSGGGDPQRELATYRRLNGETARALAATRDRIDDYLAKEGYSFVGNKTYHDSMEFLICYRADPFRYKDMDLLTALKSEPDLLQEHLPERTKSVQSINL